MRYALFALPAALFALPLPVAAQSGMPQVNQLIVYGEDTCPPSTDDVINVCARLPEDDRYRIPPNLRSDPNDPSNQAWARRAVELSYVGRAGTESCSPTGAGGWTGCFNQMVTQARAERATDERVNWNQLIEEARQERLRRMNEEILREGREDEAQEAGIPPEPPR
jgi:hypothetical protein